MKQELQDTATENHRTRVGAERRERTRLKLLESALGVFTSKGPDGVVIDDFIAAAGVSRGTFYNHFKTTSDLLLDLTAVMSDEVLEVIDPIVLHIEDPVHRFSAGTRMYMYMALSYPLWGSFLTRVGTRIAARGQMIDRYLTRDLDAALRAGRITADNLQVARDIMLGSIFYGIETMLTEPTHDHHPEHLMRCVLIGLGLKPKQAETIAYAELPLPAAITGPIFSGMTPAGRKPSATAR